LKVEELKTEKLNTQLMEDKGTEGREQKEGRKKSEEARGRAEARPLQRQNARRVGGGMKVR
jgi:hypothetical protein